jgi:hypothetical protein
VAEAGGPTEEELLGALDKVGVQDVLVQALAASVSIGYRRVSAEARDLPQARLAIEALRALEPVLRENGVDEALIRDLEQARANLQLAYAAAVAEDAAGTRGEEVDDAGSTARDSSGEGGVESEAAAPGAGEDGDDVPEEAGDEGDAAS